MKNKTNLSIFVGVVLVVAGLAVVILMGRLRAPQEQKESAEANVRFVETQTVGKTDEFVRISGFGTVKPRVSVAIPAEIPGMVRWRNELLETGGIIASGETIIKIDAGNYEIQLQRSQSNLDAANAQDKLLETEITGMRRNLEISSESLDIAMRELERFEKLADSKATSRSQLDKIRSAYKSALSIKVRDENNLNQAVVRRASARAAISQARSALAEAQLNLERTVIRAPFLCRVEERLVETGEYVTPGKILTHIYNPATLEVHVPVSISDLVWLVPESAMLSPGKTRELNSDAMVKFCVDDSLEEVCWMGKINRLSGAIDERNRTVDVIVELPAEPMLESSLPLLKGLFVEVELMGRQLKGIFKIPRANISRYDTVNIFDNGKLRIEKVEIARLEGIYAYVTAGISVNDKIVTTILPEVYAGMPLALLETEN